MLRVLEVTLPVFALVFCGFFGQRWRLLPANAVAGINAFVFFFALPAMLFRVVSTQPLGSFTDWRFAAGYASATLAVFLFTRLSALPARDERRGPATARAAAGAQATAFGLNTAHGNIGYLGLPLAIELGREHLAPMILAMICDIFLVITLGIALLEIDRRRGHAEGLLGGPAVAKTVVLGLARSPLVLSIALGLAWAVFTPPMPAAADNFVRLLGAAAGPCALFAIGASLGDRPIVVGRTVTALMLLKLIVHPVLAGLLLYGVTGADPRAAAIGVLAASLPSASNSFIIAQRYRVDAREISAAILVGTFVSLLTVSLVIWAFGLRGG